MTSSRAGEPRLQARIAAGLVIAIGVLLVIVAFVGRVNPGDTGESLFSVGPAFEEMIDDFRPILETPVLDQARADVEGLAAVGTEFQTAVMPAMSEALGMTPEQFGGFVQTEFPAVATGVAALPAIGEQFGGLIDMLFMQQSNFASADAIPTTSLPATTVPWGIFLAGLAVIAIGVVMVARPRLGGLIALVLGILLIVVPVVLSLPGKAADADDLNEALTPVYTPELIVGANTALATIGDMGAQMQGEMLPAIAQQLQLSPEQVQGFLGQFPAVSAALADFDTTLGRFDGMVSIFEVNLDNYQTVQPVSFSPIVWALVVAGVLVAALAVWGLLAARRAPMSSATPTEEKEKPLLVG